MAISTTRDSVPTTAPISEEPDALTVGRRVRHLRLARGMTLEELAAAIGKAPSQVSLLENGKREPTLSRLQAVAHALDAGVDDLLNPAPPSHRDALEVELERVQRGPLFDALGIRPVRVGRSLPTDALEAILALREELERLHSERALTPEEARRANTELRYDMRARDNYFGDLEVIAARLLDGVGHKGGPLPQRQAADLAAHLGFEIHHVPDLPHSTRSVIDRRHHRVYLPSNGIRGRTDARSALLQALASHVHDHAETRDYAELLRQRVEANYLCAALLLPERDAVRLLKSAKDERAISIEDLRDAFAVSYETAAHRFTNVVTKHLGIPVHFMKVHESGVVHKAYENDGVRFPTDALGTVEGQYVCKQWTARVAFDVPDRVSAYHQYTDTPTGTYWCTSHVADTPDGLFSVSVGVPYAQVKWFLGRDATARTTSRCPDESCCRRPPAPLARRWAGYAFPSARPHASMLATMPQGAMPGVDQTEVYEFLDRHAPA
jgi:predicted transcriptional regulator/DNA-binding Xre family transcriptional regulator